MKEDGGYEVREHRKDDAVSASTPRYQLEGRIFGREDIYSHNFLFRRDIICPVSFAIFLCFSLSVHGIAMPHIVCIDGGKDKE